MAKSPQKPKQKPEEIETVPDAWERFERAVDVALKTPPMHKEASKAEPKRKHKKEKGTK